MSLEPTSLPAIDPSPTVESWWSVLRERLLSLADDATPHYVYHVPTIRNTGNKLLDLQLFERVLYAIKANPHPEILRAIEPLGVGFECVSMGEVRRVFSACPGIDPERILLTLNFAPREEYREAFAAGVRVTVDNLYPLRNWSKEFTGRKVFLRLDLERPRGHHPHVRTAGVQSKFGIAREDIEEAAMLTRDAGCTVEGLHSHSGSGIVEAETWAETARDLASISGKHFPDATTLNVGGGLASEESIDIEAFHGALGDVKRTHPGTLFWFEPGRFLVAGAGVLLVRVTQRKRKRNTAYVGVDAGMNVLLRPSLYGARHEIVNLSRFGQAPMESVTVVGPICESGDVLRRDCRLPKSREGDILLVATTGAYGAVMSSNYNLRGRARETLIEGEATA